MRFHDLIGDRAFYRRVLAVSVPIMIQMGITNFVNLLDNIMVGRLGTESMSGVSIVNQFQFVFNLLIFGAVSGAGIFSAQYFGKGDTEGVKHTFRIKIVINALAALVAIAVFYFFPDALISLFLHDGSAEGDLALTLSEGKAYLFVMLFGLLPYALSQAYASALRETRETVVPMVASIVAIAVNFTLNLILIFGLLGAPALGVVGAAIATVISRFAELGVLVIWAHTHPARCPYLVGVYRSFRVPRALVGRVIVKGMPLMLNEFFWSLAMTMRNQCYSTRGLDVVAADNIAVTIFNVFTVVYLAMGNAIAILVGNMLGAGELEKARDADRKMIAFSVVCGLAIGLLLAATSPLFPMIYETTDAVRSLATFLMLVSAATMPFGAFANASYFTLRSGGQVVVTMLFDSVFMWVVVLPVTAFFAYGTAVGIEWLFIIGQASECLKCILGWIFLKRGTWLRQLVPDPESENENKNEVTA